jgi:peptidyl-prolyl cis-trans isomerase D
MLKIMRHHAKYFYVLFFIVILSFIFWGVGTVDQSSNAQTVAEVGKYKISIEDYGRVYDNMYKVYRDLYKDQFNEEMQNRLKLRERALDTLIGQTVLLIAAEENGLRVSDSELKEAILNEPAFMRDGIFSNEVYQNMLRLSRLTPVTFEVRKREELLIGKMSRLIQATAIMPEGGADSISADEQTRRAILDAMMNEAREKIVLSYIEGMKKRLKIKINSELL